MTGENNGLLSAKKIELTQLIQDISEAFYNLRNTVLGLNVQLGVVDNQKSSLISVLEDYNEFTDVASEIFARDGIVNEIITSISESLKLVSSNLEYDKMTSALSNLESKINSYFSTVDSGN